MSCLSGVVGECMRQISAGSFDVVRMRTAVGAAMRVQETFNFYGQALLFLRANWTVPAASSGAANAARLNRMVLGPPPPAAAAAAAAAARPSVRTLARAMESAAPAQPAPPRPAASRAVALPGARAAAPPPPSPSPAPAPSHAAVAAVEVYRPLMLSCCQRSGGTRVFEYHQDSLADRLGPQVQTEGFCAALTGIFLSDPSALTQVTLVVGIKALTLQGQYDAGRVTAFDFLTANFAGLSYVGVRAAVPLTPQNAMEHIDRAARTGTKHMLCVTRGGGGHGMGVVTDAAGTYLFFDPNEGLASFPDRDKFWAFLYHYIMDAREGLATDYDEVFLATWR